jgi:hypothetical protein
MTVSPFSSVRIAVGSAVAAEAMREGTRRIAGRLKEGMIGVILAVGGRVAIRLPSPLEDAELPVAPAGKVAEMRRENRIRP